MLPPDPEIGWKDSKTEKLKSVPLTKNLVINVHYSTCLFDLRWDCFIPLMGRTVERWKESTGQREGSGTSKGPRDGNQTRVAASTTASYVDTPTTRPSALTWSEVLVTEIQKMWKSESKFDLCNNLPMMYNKVQAVFTAKTLNVLHVISYSKIVCRYWPNWGGEYFCTTSSKKKIIYNGCSECMYLHG